jgi:plastocyanin
VERIVAVADGKLANVFVYIKEGMADWPEPASTTPVVLDQSGCMYSPRVIGVQVGQPVTFLNSDPVMHNIHGMGDANGFNAGMPGKDQRITRKFETAEVMLKMKCDVHPWMTAYIGVVPHPYFAVTGAKGEFTFEKVPPGDYVIEAWHELYGTQQAKVTLTPKGEVKADFAFKG